MVIHKWPNIHRNKLLKKNRNMKLKLVAPVVLGIVLISLVVLFLPQELANYFVFNTNRNQPFDHGLVTNILGHAGPEHLFGNAMMLLLVGPSVEARYGSVKLLGMILFTSICICILHYALNPNVGLLGASGIVFMCITLSAFTGNGDSNKRIIPISAILILILYVGNEVYNCLQVDSVSQLAHIVGGVFGFLYGIILKPKNQEVAWEKSY